MQNYCSLVKKFGRKRPQQAFSTLPWKAITAPKYINLSVSTSYHTFKNIMEVFKNIRFQTDSATNLKEVNFLDSKWKISSLQKVQQ